MTRFSFSVILFSILINYFSYPEIPSNVLQPDKSLGRTVEVASNKAIIRLKPGYNDKDLLRLFKNYNIIIDNQLLENSQSITINPKNINNRLMSAVQLRKIITAEEPLLRTYIISYEEDSAPELFCKKILKQSAMIEIAEPVTIDQQLAYLPNDPKTYEQGLLANCKIFDAWDAWKGDTSMVIAISDGGVFQEHEDLIGNIAPNWNEIPNDGIDNDNNGYIDDYIGCNLAYKADGTEPGRTFHSSDHGTGVASIAAASTDNSKGMAGVGFKCRFFPIKSAKITSTYVSYGYQSIIYAAIRGFKVMNCSWGSPKQFSQIDQSVIDYAVSRDVAIVAAAGNENGDIVPVYPASYKGVLSVGNVDLNDQVATSSSLGANLDIMAPGEGNEVATNVQGGYQIESNGGTSFASPVVAGVLGLVRSKYPQLSSQEAITFIRMMVDDIRDKNLTVAGMLPGRVNAYKAVTTDPMSLPGIVYQSHEFLNNGEIVERINSGQTVDLKINCTNILGKASNLRFVLSTGYDFSATINIIDSVVLVANVERNSNFSLDKFSFSVNNDYTGLVILRIDIYGDNNYHDFFMIPFVPSTEVTNLGNNIMKFSVGDRGQIGFSGSGSEEQGIGVCYKNYGNMIYNAGMMMSAYASGNNLVSSSLFGSYSTGNDFVSVKAFVPPQKNAGIFNDDANYGYKIGAEVEEVFNIPPDNINIMAVDVSIKNNSNLSYTTMAMGYFFDWDIFPDSDSNLVGLFPEAIPESFKAIAAAAEFASFVYPEKSVVCGCASFSNDETYVAQAAGMNYSTIQNFSTTAQFAALNSGTGIQNPEMNDINMIVGMKFPGPIAKGDKRTFKFFFGCADTKALLADAIKNSMLGLSVRDDKNVDKIDVNLAPNPAEETLVLSIKNVNSSIQIRFTNIMGMEVLEGNNIFQSGNECVVTKNIVDLPAGIYFAIIQSGKEQIIRTFIKD